MAQSAPPPPPYSTPVPPERDPNPGPFIIFFNDAGMLPEDDEVIKRAVDVWQFGDNEAFLLCERERAVGSAVARRNKHVSQVAARLHAHGAKLVISGNPWNCSGPLLTPSQRDYDSVEIRGTYAQ